MLTVLVASTHSQATTVLSSPDGRIRLQIAVLQDGDDSRLTYEIAYQERPLVAPSTISFVRDDGVQIGARLSDVAVSEPTKHRSTWKPVYGERSTIEDNYNQISIDCHDSVAHCPVRVVFRCYDAGVAFQTFLGNKDSHSPLNVEEERTEFCFHNDHVAWCTSHAQGEYRQRRISQIGAEVERPLVLQVDDNTYVAIAEAKLVDYARMKIRQSDGKRNCLVSALGGKVHSPQPLETPWRVVMVADSPGQLLENNDLLLNLNDPCAIADTSWIKPGKVIRDITLTNEGAKACIEFAAEHDLQYVEFDAGWYGEENDSDADATTVTPNPLRSKGKFDLHRLIEYAADREIGIILYVNHLALERQLDDILPRYKEWGVAGIKYGFVNVGSQRWTAWLHEAVRKAADYELMVDVHDEYRPTGYSRTYPNLMTQEGVRGDETSASAEQAITTLFTRGLAGAADRTVCYFDSRVDEKWSHAHQLAKAVCCYSPWQFLYWYDTPLANEVAAAGRDSIKEVPELEFFNNLPTTWDDTKVLRGQIGQHAVIARRSGDDWFIGAMNGSKPQELDVPLTFLEDNRKYIARIYTDDPAHETATSVAITRRTVNSSTTLKLSLQSNGGEAIWLTPESEFESASTEVEKRVAIDSHGNSDGEGLQ